MASNTSRYRLAASGGRGTAMADVRDELSGVFEFEDCSGMSGLDVLLLEMVAETHD